MAAVFPHGGLRLYLLRLLDGGPRHGYELIRLLSDRFDGAYTPSAGTIYPRLRRMVADGHIRPAGADPGSVGRSRLTGGRKIYEITDAGRVELRRRHDELAELESAIAVAAARSGSSTAVTRSAPAAAPASASSSASASGGRSGSWSAASESAPSVGGAGAARPESGAARWGRLLGGRVEPLAVARLDRRLSDFAAEARGLLAAARFAGAEPERLASALDAALDAARHELRRSLS